MCKQDMNCNIKKITTIDKDDSIFYIPCVDINNLRKVTLMSKNFSKTFETHEKAMSWLKEMGIYNYKRFNSDY